jgi:hypothetical protein
VQLNWWKRKMFCDLPANTDAMMLRNHVALLKLQGGASLYIEKGQTQNPLLKL